MALFAKRNSQLQQKATAAIDTAERLKESRQALTRLPRMPRLQSAPLTILQSCSLPLPPKDNRWSEYTLFEPDRWPIINVDIGYQGAHAYRCHIPAPNN